MPNGFFGQNLLKRSKTEKGKITILRILHMHNKLGTKFQLQQQFWFFGTNFPKKLFPVEKRKKKGHDWILQIRISVVIKF